MPKIHPDRVGATPQTTVVDPNQVMKDIEAQADMAGVTKEDVRRAGWQMSDIADPYGPNPWAQKEEIEWNEFEQPPLADFISGVYNELILGVGEGVSELIPTIAQAAGNEGEWSKNWINNTSDWFEKQRVMYSDSAYKPVDTFADYFSGGKFWSTLGEGVGFVAALSLTRGLGSAAKATSFANRVKGFATGTTMMYGNIYDEAIEAGFEPKDAARMGLGIAGVVSLTEGAALEWVGKGATAWMPKTFVNSTFKRTLGESAELGSKDFWKTNKLFSKNLMDGLTKKEAKKVFREQSLIRAKMGVAQGTQGAAIEMGQEFSQTYIEGIGKELYDSLVTNTNNFDKMGFGEEDRKDWYTALGGEKVLDEAIYGGIIGGIIGGGMGAYSGIQNNIDTALGYIEGRVKKGDKKSLDKMYANVDKQLEKGKIDETEHNNIVTKLKDLEKYATQTKNLSIDDHKANHQLYETLRTQEEATLKMNDVFDEGDLPLVVTAAYQKNKERAEKVIAKQNEEAEAIIASKKPLTTSKQKFYEMQQGFLNLYADVFKNELTDEQFEERLSKVGIKSKENEQKVSDQQKSKEAKETIQKRKDGKTVSSVQKQETAIVKAKNAIKEAFELDDDFDLSEDQPGKMVNDEFIPDNLGEQMFNSINKTMKGERSDKEEASRLFKEYAKEVHPDKHTNEEAKAISEEIFKAMTIAKSKGKVNVLKKLKEKHAELIGEIKAVSSVQSEKEKISNATLSYEQVKGIEEKYGVKVEANIGKGGTVKYDVKPTKGSAKEGYQNVLFAEAAIQEMQKEEVSEKQKTTDASTPVERTSFTITQDGITTKYRTTKYLDGKRNVTEAFDEEQGVWVDAGHGKRSVEDIKAVFEEAGDKVEIGEKENYKEFANKKRWNGLTTDQKKRLDPERYAEETGTQEITDIDDEIKTVEDEIAYQKQSEHGDLSLVPGLESELETLKQKKDAIQKRKAEKVAVQEQAGTSQEVQRTQTKEEEQKEAIDAEVKAAMERFR